MPAIRLIAASARRSLPIWSGTGTRTTGRREAADAPYRRRRMWPWRDGERRALGAYTPRHACARDRALHAGTRPRLLPWCNPDYPSRLFRASLLCAAAATHLRALARARTSVRIGASSCHRHRRDVRTRGRPDQGGPCFGEGSCPAPRIADRAGPDATVSGLPATAILRGRRAARPRL